MKIIPGEIRFAVQRGARSCFGQCHVVPDTLIEQPCSVEVSVMTCTRPAIDILGESLSLSLWKMDKNALKLVGPGTWSRWIRFPIWYAVRLSRFVLNIGCIDSTPTHIKHCRMSIPRTLGLVQSCNFVIIELCRRSSGTL